jgi:hypothetical protein
VGIEADNNAATFLTLTTSIEMPEMPKRSLADRILDEVLTLRRPRTLMLEFDDDTQTERGAGTPQDQSVAPDEHQSDVVVSSTGRRQLIVE